MNSLAIRLAATIISSMILLASSCVPPPVVEYDPHTRSLEVISPQIIAASTSSGVLKVQVYKINGKYSVRTNYYSRNSGWPFFNQALSFGVSFPFKRTNQYNINNETTNAVSGCIATPGRIFLEPPAGSVLPPPYPDFPAGSVFPSFPCFMSSIRTVYVEDGVFKLTSNQFNNAAFNGLQFELVSSTSLSKIAGSIPAFIFREMSQ